MDVVVRVNDAVNGFVWGVPAMVCIIGVGLWLALRLVSFRFADSDMR